MELPADVEDFELTFDEPEPDERYDGEPGTPFRYRRHFYGFMCDVTVEAEGMDEVTVKLSGDEQASAFDVMY